ncbi:hypothetical protein BDD12DRAFT_840602 [Trichophaea hybrida]|nr:hypothetical protein BDD12DRAFT_840602 [Trichophaea hybrida]
MVDHFSFGFDADARTVTLLGREYSLATLIRTTIFLCGYLLLRPFLLKLSGKFQASDHARDVGDDDNESPAATGKVARGAEEDSDGEDEGWGAKARRRARAERQRIMEEDREADEHEDKELEALLED